MSEIQEERKQQRHRVNGRIKGLNEKGNKDQHLINFAHSFFPPPLILSVLPFPFHRHHRLLVALLLVLLGINVNDNYQQALINFSHRIPTPSPNEYAQRCEDVGTFLIDIERFEGAAHFLDQAINLRAQSLGLFVWCLSVSLLSVARSIDRSVYLSVCVREGERGMGGIKPRGHVSRY